jgi:hypothetical protein
MPAKWTIANEVTRNLTLQQDGSNMITIPLRDDKTGMMILKAASTCLV